MAALVNGVAAAAPGDLLFTLTAPEPQEGATFGDMVRAVDGDVLISEPERLFAGTNARGQAHLFDGVTGQLKWTFKNPGQLPLDNFAQAITGGDGHVFISTIGTEERVYAFSASTGAVLHSMTNPVPNNNFGAAVAYGDGSLLVSSPTFSQPAFQVVGRAYLFNALSGDLERPLPNPEPKAGDAFSCCGAPLAITGNKAIVGSIADDLPGDTRPDGDNPGRVWVFDRATGATLLTLENPNTDNQVAPNFFSDRFGASVAAGGGLIAVGARMDSTDGVFESGSVYVFDGESGALRHTLLSPHPEDGGEFGRSVAVTPEGDVLVGAWHTSLNGLNAAGRAFLFDGETGNLLLDIPHPAPTSGDGFGWSVWATEGRILVSAPTGNPFGPVTGAVYVFEGIPEPGTVVMGVVAFFTSLALWHSAGTAG